MSVTANKKRENPTKQPAQHSQPSRKGKRSWRKNINIGDVEEGLEELRTEERVTGCVVSVLTVHLHRLTGGKYHSRSALHKKKDDELFTIDVTGDDKSEHCLLPVLDEILINF